MRPNAALLASLLTVIPGIAATNVPMANGIALGLPRRVSAPNSGRYEMMWAKANLTDARYIMICGMHKDPYANTISGYLYTSSDAGTTWTRTATDASSDWVSEEHCAYGAGRNAYFTTGESNTDTGSPRHEYGKLQLFASHDYGITWQKTVTRSFVDWTFTNVLMPAGNQPERLVIFGSETADRPGHWSSDRPVAFESTDGGLSLQGPFSVPRSPDFMYGGEYAFGTVLLPNATVLFSATSTEKAELFAYLPQTRRLRSFSIIHSGTSSWPVPLARDESAGPFHGRLYVGWIEMAGTRARAMLVTSDDDGTTWSSPHEMFRGSGFTVFSSCQRVSTDHGSTACRE